ncbi:hypothetical protein EXIGLDRAFT_809850 [Exidia glandulosa HHB12029]|uniref:Alpha-type protein kinase domain-containing protein n=1 Tax=Exidia glandulosa HHB12029 TaxID=1314781 RepID=A0A165CT79_EXIGL|nr:hypothetical protein EXIGLDRAFT_809850 [Exidia glandulosa HHB12029]
MGPSASASDCWHEDEDSLSEICQGEFPHKSAVGPCALCAKRLKMLAANEPGVAELIATYKQCEGCGVYSAQLHRTIVNNKQFCARCVRVSGFVDPKVVEQQAAVSQATQDRLKKNAPPFGSGYTASAGGTRVPVEFGSSGSHGAMPPPPPPPGPFMGMPPPPAPLSNRTNSGGDAGPKSVHTTAGLAMARSDAVSSHTSVPFPRPFARFICSVTPMAVGQTKNTKLVGSKTLLLSEFTMADEDFISDVIQQVLVRLNPTFTRLPCAEGNCLIEKDVELRAGGNRTIEPGSLTKTIRQYHEVINGEDLRQIYGEKKTDGKKPNPSTQHKISFVLAILIDTFLERIDRAKDDEPVRTPGAAFVPPSRLALGFNSSGLMGRIKYIKGEIVTSSTGTVDILFDDGYKTDETLILMALMSNEILAQGASKEVYKLKAGTAMFAAKCFKKVNDEDAVVSHDDNRAAIFGEIMNICAGQWLLNLFFNEAKSANVAVHTSLKFTDVHIIQQLKPDSTTGNDELDRHWLLEPLRTVSVRKFSGTMDHPAPTDLLERTVHAFVHWAFMRAKGQAVYADMQASLGPINGLDGWHLFDPMLHTAQGAATVGDHGMAGIEKWKEVHECDEVCIALQLPDPATVSEE